MAHPLRIEFEGAFYYLMARGNARQSIFLDDDDRQSFIDNLGRVCQRFDWMVWAWCLMDNHYRLLIETCQPTLSKGMRELKGVYTQAFNRRHRRVGHVMQGRYKAILVGQTPTCWNLRATSCLILSVPIWFRAQRNPNEQAARR